MEVKACRRSDAIDRLEKVTNLRRNTCCCFDIRLMTLRDTSHPAIEKVVGVILSKQTR